MKKKILIFISLIFVFAFIFAISVCAEEYLVTYRDIWGSVKQTATTDANGQITIRDQGFTNHSGKTLFGWYTVEGDVYDVGETVTLTSDLDLYEAYGYDGTNESIKYQGATQGNSQWDQIFVRLQEDIVLESRIAPPWGGRVIIDLNGYSITSSAKNLFEEQRAGVILVGEGSVIHTGTGNFFNASSHGFGDGNQRLIVGKDVTISTNGTLLHYTNGNNSVIPIHIFGKASCAKIAYISTLNHELDIKINAKDLTVTGDALFTIGTYDAAGNGKVRITVTDGYIKLAENASGTDYWNNNNTVSYGDRQIISISGGTFNVAFGDKVEEYIASGYKIQPLELGGATYYIVVEESECAHTYAVTSEINATCIALAEKTYTCSKCNHTYTVAYGDYADHDWELVDDKQPTYTSAGVKSYECKVCFDTKSEIYYDDVAEKEVKVTVKTDEIEEEVSVKVSDVFNLESMGNNQYKLVGLKDFGGYTVANIVAINVPVGIADINFASENTTLQKLIIIDGANVTVSSFANCIALTHIEIGASTVKFVKGCTNKVISSIKSEVQGADVTFDAQVFDGRSSITELKLSSYSKYVFGSNSFRKVGITEFIAPDYSDVTFKMDPPFYSCSSLKYIYLGRGIKYLDGKAFDYCQNVEKIVLMDVVKIIQEYTFCVENTAEKPVEVYIHSDSLSLPNNTFYQCHGVTIYTNAPITNGSAFNGCTEVTKNGVYYPAYTIVYGIPHKLVEAYEEPTCLEVGVNGYKTDCPCGVQLDGEVTARTFTAALTNSETFVDKVYYSTVIPATGHFEGDIVYVDYLNGYMLEGLKDCICRVCNEEYTELVPSADPLFVFLGYSMPEDGRLEITMGFMINNKAIDTYEELSGNTFNYGVVLALENNLNGKAPLDSEVVSYTQKTELDRKLCGFDLKVSGFNDNIKDLSVVMAIYVTDGDTTVYLQATQTNLPTGVSINSLI